MFVTINPTHWSTSGTASSATMWPTAIRRDLAAAYGGGGWNGDNTEPLLENTLVCGNTPDQIDGEDSYAGYVDNGGNAISETCPPLGACCVGDCAATSICYDDLYDFECAGSRRHVERRTELCRRRLRCRAVGRRGRRQRALVCGIFVPGLLHVASLSRCRSCKRR